MTADDRARGLAWLQANAAHIIAVLRRTFGWCRAVDDPWRQILAVQRDLIAIGHHRGPSVIDILIALTAATNRLTLIHADADFASISRVRPAISMIKVADAASA